MSDDDFVIRIPRRIEWMGIFKIGFLLCGLALITIGLGYALADFPGNEIATIRQKFCSIYSCLGAISLYLVLILVLYNKELSH